MLHRAEQPLECSDRRCADRADNERPGHSIRSWTEACPNSEHSRSGYQNKHATANAMCEPLVPVAVRTHCRIEGEEDVREEGKRRIRGGANCSRRALGLFMTFVLAIGLPQAVYSGSTFTGLQPANGPNMGGDQVTILGVEFGHFNQEIRARVGFSACTSTQWISDSSIVATLHPAGVRFQDTLVFTFPTSSVYTVTGAFTFDAPVLYPTSGPGNAAANAQATITFRGKEFGSYNSSPKARIGDTACITTVWKSVDSIACKVPHGAHPP